MYGLSKIVLLKEKIMKNFNNKLQIGSDEKIIYGVGEGGVQAYKHLINSNFKVKYFVDDNKKLQGKKKFSIEIISFNQLKQLSERYLVSNILIAIPSLAGNKLDNFVKKLEKISPNVEFLTSKKNLTSNNINLSDINSVVINNILNRKEKKFHTGLFKDIINKNILITGAGGSIGSELCRQLAEFKVNKIVALDNSEISIYNLIKTHKNKKKIKFILGDIIDYNLISELIKRNKIDIIYHTAAYKHVSILEKNLVAAVKNNVIGTINILENSVKNNCNFIFISTDKAVKPTSNLGITKRIAEIICQSYKDVKKNSKINIVRFGNVFGSVGSAIPLFLEQINNNLPITITNKKVKRYFMTIKEACLLLLASTAYHTSRGTLILNMGKPILVIDIIKKLITLRERFNPTYKYLIIETGLGKGEKLTEELVINKKSLIEKNKIGILECFEPSYQFDEVQNLISKIKFYSINFRERPLTLLLKKFLIKEIKNHI